MKLCSFLLFFALGQLTICLGAKEKDDGLLSTTSEICRERNANTHKSTSRKRRRQDADMGTPGAYEEASPRKQRKITDLPSELLGITLSCLDARTCVSLARASKELNQVVIHEQTNFLLKRGMDLESFFKRLNTTDDGQELSVTVEGRSDAAVWERLREVKGKITSFSWIVDRPFITQSPKDYFAFDSFYGALPENLERLEIIWRGGLCGERFVFAEQISPIVFEPEHLRRLKNLKTLRINNVTLEEQRVINLSEAPFMKHLKTVDLSGCRIGLWDSNKITDLFSALNPSLLQLNLSGNELEDKDVLKLTEHNFSNLQSLNLLGNDITPSAAETLRTALLEKFPSLDLRLN